MYRRLSNLRSPELLEYRGKQALFVYASGFSQCSEDRELRRLDNLRYISRCSTRSVFKCLYGAASGTVPGAVATGRHRRRLLCERPVATAPGTVPQAPRFPLHAIANRYKLGHATLGQWYSTARVSKRPAHQSAACLRARYCTNLAWLGLEFLEHSPRRCGRAAQHAAPR